MTVALDVKCDLCGLPVKSNAFETRAAGALFHFCCAGCQNVHAILREAGGLEDVQSSSLFRISRDMGLLGTGSGPAEPETARSAVGVNPYERDIEIPVAGMWCASCSWLIERVLQKRPGVLECRVSFVSDRARVRYDPQQISRQEIQDQIKQLGYRPEKSGSKAENSVERDLLIRFSIACAPGMYMMMFNFILYEGYFSHLDPGVRVLMHQLLFWLSLPIVTYCAWPIYRKAWGSLRSGAATMDTLVALGIVSAYGYSVYATFHGLAQVYFDTASMIVTLVLLGKWLEAIARARATSAVGSLMGMLPQKVRLRLPDGEERLTAADQLQVGDVALVDAGSAVPVDGVVIDGSASVDESLLTGEATPVRRSVGDRVVGASLCLEGGLVIQATAVGQQSTVSRMASLVQEAMASRSGSERLADRVSRVFIPAIIAAAGLVFCHVYATAHAVEPALLRAVSILVVACPCALGMATPLAVAAAMGSAARRGLLIRNSASLEKARDVNTVVLDKTGTVTLGRLELVELLPLNPEASPAAWDAVLSVEALSQHPAARAIERELRQRGSRATPEVHIEVIPGRGVRGRAAGHDVVIGAVELGGELPEQVRAQLAEAEAEGRTVVLAACDGHPLAAFVLADVPRPEAAEAIRAMQQRGIQVCMVSGDSERTTQTVARRLGITDVYWRALPADKIERVKALQRAGRCVAMVGDGINDGPALAQADLGIAMGEGTQLAVEAADLALMAPDLRRLPYAFGLSQRAVRIIRQNLFWAFVYNILSVPAAAGLFGPRLTIGPLFAAAAMLTSSLSVVFNSLRLQNDSGESSSHRAGPVPVEAPL